MRTVAADRGEDVDGVEQQSGDYRAANEGDGEHAFDVTEDVIHRERVDRAKSGKEPATEGGRVR